MNSSLATEATENPELEPQNHKKAKVEKRITKFPAVLGMCLSFSHNVLTTFGIGSSPL